MTATAAYRALFVAGLAGFFLSAAWGLAFGYFHEGKLPDVRESLRTLEDHIALASLEPRSAATQGQLAEALRQRGRLEEATRAYESVVKLDPRAVEARVWLARLYLREGRPELARERARAALERGAEIEAPLLQALGLEREGS